MDLLKLIILHEVDELDSLKKVWHVISSLLLSFSLEYRKCCPQEMQCYSAIFASVETESDLLRSKLVKIFTYVTYLYISSIYLNTLNDESISA